MMLFLSTIYVWLVGGMQQILETYSSCELSWNETRAFSLGRRVDAAIPFEEVGFALGGVVWGKIRKPIRRGRKNLVVLLRQISQ